MRKVLVIGSPGAGKSQFAAELATLVGLPVMHLDRLYHDPVTRYYDDKAAWRRYVAEELVHRDSWVMDGHYPATLGVRMEASDTVVFLDFPTRVSLARAVHRRLRPTDVRPDMPPDWKEHLSISLLRSIVLFRGHEARRVRGLLKHFAEGRRFIVLSTPGQAAAFLATLEGASPQSSPPSDRARAREQPG